MKQLRVSEMMNSSISRIYSMRRTIQTDPEYQRTSEIWNLEKNSF